MTIRLVSEAFGQHEAIPKKYTGEGQDVSPPLRWSEVPEGTKQLALIADDPDAPTAKPWVHWLIYNIPADVDRLPEGIIKRTTPADPAGVAQGENSFGRIGYGGPMPPPGDGVHHYQFRIYALDIADQLEPALDKDKLLKAIADHILAEGELVGTYQR